MQTDRFAALPEQALPAFPLREACLGCTDCHGPCLDMLELERLPELLLDPRKAPS